jgi:hypothetical protein
MKCDIGHFMKNRGTVAAYIALGSPNGHLTQRPTCVSSHTSSIVLDICRTSLAEESETHDLCPVHFFHKSCGFRDN